MDAAQCRDVVHRRSCQIEKAQRPPEAKRGDVDQPQAVLQAEALHHVPGEVAAVVDVPAVREVQVLDGAQPGGVDHTRAVR